MFTEVAVDFSYKDRLRTYTYAIPKGVTVHPGDLLWVPFAYRPIQGIAISISETTETENTREVESVIPDGPFINPHLLKTAVWIADHYRTSIFRACVAMLPPGANQQLHIWVQRSDIADRVDTALTGFSISADQHEVLNEIPANGRVRRDRLVRKIGRKNERHLDALVRAGIAREESIWERPRVSAVFRSHIKLTDEIDANETIETYTNRRANRRADLVRHLASTHHPIPRADLSKQFSPSLIKSVIDDGNAQVEKVRIERDPLADYAVQEPIEVELIPEQSAAVSAISKSIDSNSHAEFLLFGVTGSGKTEVYLRAVEKCIQAGRRAIIMVPEIAMTPQTLQRFASRFPGQIALQHSGLTLGQRFDQWHQIKLGRYNVVIGSRSSIFAPVDNPGLVVIDEEHEWTFKQSDRAPRYHARDVAERLCQQSNATLVLGSATPDIGTYHQATDPTSRNPITLLQLPRRINEALRMRVGLGSPLPSVGEGQGEGPSPFEAKGDASERSEVAGACRDGSGARSVQSARPVSQRSPNLSTPPSGHTQSLIVDMRLEIQAGHREMLSRPLLDALQENVDQGGKSILFINRRGSASFVQCLDCGTIRQCPNCQTPLSLHRRPRRGGGSRLQCHYCSYSLGAARQCRNCDGTGIARRAAGTEGVEETVRGFFPNTPILRWDSDTARNANEHTKLLDEFQSKGNHILVGTQMVAKGLDIPDVSLVGVVAADIGLAVPSFRSSERTFQILSQVTGRAGRADTPGKAIIQTFQPNHFAIIAAADQDYQAFYQHEIETRDKYDLPPFTSYARLAYSSYEQNEAQLEAQSLKTRLDQYNKEIGEAVEITGPSPAYPARQAGRYRWQILLKSKTQKPAPNPAQILDQVPLGPGWTTDIDPIEMN